MNHKPEFSESDKNTLPVEKGMKAFLTEQCKQLGDLIYLFVFKHHEVQIGAIQNGQINLERQEELVPDLVKEIRAFSDTGELYIWNQGGSLKYRLRIDGKGDEAYFIYPENHYLWGNKKTDTTVFEENRGMELKIPFKVNDLKLPLQYQVKNYYKFDADGLIQFEDSRLVKLLNAEGKPIQ